jgi:predicted  nucleic acid-binding Zn-ribbon protein
MSTSIEEQMTGFRSRLYKALLEKEIYQDKINALNDEIKALRNLIAGIEIAITAKQSTPE